MFYTNKQGIYKNMPRCLKRWYRWCMVFTSNHREKNIGNLMTDMCKNDGIQGRKCSHSTRTVINTLLHDGVAPTPVVQINRHNDAHSRNDYGSASRKGKQRHVNLLSTMHNCSTDFNEEWWLKSANHFTWSKSCYTKHIHTFERVLTNFNVDEIDDQNLLDALQEVEDAMQRIHNFVWIT